RLGEAARLDWVPQETILFDRAGVKRSLHIDMAASATLTMLEILVLGRVARGEEVRGGYWHDSWRIRRDGVLALAEEVRLGGAMADLMQRPAIGSGARTLATLVHVAPSAENRLAAVRERLQQARSSCAASAWNGMLVARFLASDPQAVRADAAAAAIA